MPDASAFPRLKVEPLHVSVGLRRLACDAIKSAITEMDIYGRPGEIRLDERQLSEDLGVSRTPIREALSVLEQEGFVRTVPRRGIYVVRKTKREVIEMITVWAAIESLAARFADRREAHAEILRQLPLVEANLAWPAVDIHLRDGALDGVASEAPQADAHMQRLDLEARKSARVRHFGHSSQSPACFVYGMPRVRSVKPRRGQGMAFAR